VKVSEDDIKTKTKNKILNSNAVIHEDEVNTQILEFITFQVLTAYPVPLAEDTGHDGHEQS